MNRLIGSALGVLLVTTATLAAQDQTIRRPENLPEPVGEDRRVEATDIDATLADSNVVLLDVREPWELEKLGTREGYINIPLAELEERLDELPKRQDHPHCLKRRGTGRACRGLADEARVHVGRLLRTARLRWRSRVSGGNVAVVADAVRLRGHLLTVSGF